MRSFKINGIKFEIVNICDSIYKYEVLKFEEDKRYWINAGKCNTLKQGKEVAYNFIQRQEEIERLNREAEIEERKYLDKLDKTKVYCSDCGEELSLDDKINLDDICYKCIKKYY